MSKTTALPRTNESKDMSTAQTTPAPPAALQCVICFDQMEEADLTDLSNCTHNEFHRSCLVKCFKAECPLCRKPHDIPVSGEPPKDNDSGHTPYVDESLRDLLDPGAEVIFRRRTTVFQVSIPGASASSSVSAFVSEVVEEYGVPTRRNTVEFSGYDFGPFDQEFVRGISAKHRDGEASRRDLYAVAVAAWRAENQDSNLNRLPGFDEDGEPDEDDSDYEHEYGYDGW